MALPKANQPLRYIAGSTVTNMIPKWITDCVWSFHALTW